MKYFFLSFAVFIGITTVVHAHSEDVAQDIEPSREEFAIATIVDILREEKDESFGFQRTTQEVLLRFTNGPHAGIEFTIMNAIMDDREDMRLSPHERVIVRLVTQSDGSVEYLIAEKYRLPALFSIGVFFLLLTILFGGWMGLQSIGGLIVSIIILATYIVPSIASGGSPILISLLGSCGIACSSLYLAHGFHKRTSVALLSTLLTLCIATVLSLLFVKYAQLFGMGSEESLYLQTGVLEHINLRGLLLGGIIIGCLGVLDDVTTGQTAAVDEIRKANPSLSTQELWKAGLSVGREHIASLINTLALAYAGASLPLLLLFQAHESYPLWVTLNSEFLAEEIIRTLVGSAALLFAVPLSTWLAVRLLKGEAGPSSHPCHFHGHVHLQQKKM